MPRRTPSFPGVASTMATLAATVRRRITVKPAAEACASKSECSRSIRFNSTRSLRVSPREESSGAPCNWTMYRTVCCAPALSAKPSSRRTEVIVLIVRLDSLGHTFMPATRLRTPGAPPRWAHILRFIRRRPRNSTRGPLVLIPPDDSKDGFFRPLSDREREKPRRVRMSFGRGWISLGYRREFARRSYRKGIAAY